MIKHIKIALLTLFITSYFCSYSFAMKEEEENPNIHVLKMALKAEENCQKLRKENKQLVFSLKTVIKLVDVLLDQETTPTTHSYLKAVYRQDKNFNNTEEIEKLYSKATTRQTINNIIVDGHTKFKHDAPEANIELLKMSNLFNKLQITEEYATIKYGKVTIKETPEKKVNEYKETVTTFTEIKHDMEDQYKTPSPRKMKNTNPFPQDIPQGISIDFQNLDNKYK